MRWASADERFWAKVDKSGECWLWTGAIAGGGYGDFWDGKKWAAHRWSYTQVNGPIPVGLQLDHLCRTRGCVRPSHLEAVSQAENIRRGQGHGSETHCPAGHPYSPENTYRAARGDRQCLVCIKRRSLARSNPTQPTERQAS